MSSSYRKIDYRVRPAKSIERKMLVESFRRLSEFGSITGYRYVGFGSLFFADFLLVHKALGIENMISIEGATARVVQERFMLNVPYGHVEMRFGHSNVVLPRLAWDVRTICWLDYDGILNSSTMEDVKYVAGNAPSGSLLLASFNAGDINKVDLEDDDGDPVEGVTLVEKLRRLVRPFPVPPDVKPSDLAGWGVGEVYRRIFDEAVQETLRTRNATRTPGNHLKYRQLYYFRYSDGVKMITCGGIIFDEGQEALLNRSGFEQLDFVRPGTDAYLIEPPNLTYVEMRQIDAARKRPSIALPVPPGDIKRYEGTYRYFPRFIEAEIS